MSNINVETINKYLNANSLPPNEGYLLRDAGQGEFIAEWSVGIPKPTKQELDAAWLECVADKEANAYKGQRVYPPIGDQLDAIMKWVDGETEITISPELESIAMQCMSVKAQHPKPE